jgi:hypothetical protein
MKTPLSSPIPIFLSLLPSPHSKAQRFHGGLSAASALPLCHSTSRDTLTPPGEAESGSAGTQPDKEYPGEGVPMVRQAPAASGCQGPPFCAPSAALSIPQKIRPFFLGKTVPRIGPPKFFRKTQPPCAGLQASESGASLAVEGCPQPASIRVVCLVQAPITPCCMRPKAITRSVGPGQPISFSVPHRDNLLRPRSPRPNF